MKELTDAVLAFLKNIPQKPPIFPELIYSTHCKGV
jgi:hypothetical protein